MCNFKPFRQVFTFFAKFECCNWKSNISQLWNAKSEFGIISKINNNFIALWTLHFPWWRVGYKCDPRVKLLISFASVLVFNVKLIFVVWIFREHAPKWQSLRNSIWNKPIPANSKKTWISSSCLPHLVSSVPGHRPRSSAWFQVAKPSLMVPIWFLIHANN